MSQQSRKKLGRRQFLKRAAGIAGAAALPMILPSRVLGRTGQPAPSERINLALIGCGGMGLTDMNNLISLPDTEFVAVCDVDKEHQGWGLSTAHNHERNVLGREKPTCVAYNDFEEVLAREDVDAVVIATPDHWHAGIAIAAAKAGKDIYGEKPLARTITEGRNMVNTIHRYGRIFQMGTQTRSHQPAQHIVNLLRNGAIGKIRKVEVNLPQYGGGAIYAPKPIPDGFDYERWLGPAPWAPYQPERCHGFFRVVLDYSGGTITDHGTHRLDMAQWGTGLESTGPVKIEGEGMFPKDGLYDAVTIGRFQMTFADGTVYDCWTEPDVAQWGVKFIGDEGWIKFPMEAPLPHRPITASNPKILTRPILPRQRVAYESDNHWRNFIDCVKTRRTPAQNIDVGHRSTSLPHLGNIAMELGRPLEWDPDKERFVNDAEANTKLDRPKREPWARFFEA